MEGWTDNYIRVRAKNRIDLQNKISEVELNNLDGIKAVEGIIIN